MPKSLPSVRVFRDGLLARRAPLPVDAATAERTVRALNHLPTILEAWSQPIPRSQRRIVCWLPATARAQAAMESTLVLIETKKAQNEGTRFVWSASPLGEHARVCYNPKSCRSYLVTKRGRDCYQCQCPRFAAAGICKHTLDATLRKRFAPGQS